uniref:Uncharacterized protein n=1 Tax=Clastoptera arizonana TaxID=38151 RepID=A0A1B6D905_9HEMI
MMLGLSKEVLVLLMCLLSSEVFTLGGVGGRGGLSSRVLTSKTGNTQRSAFTGLDYPSGSVGYNQSPEAAKQVHKQSKSHRGIGISAWALVGVILTFIIGGTAVYYFILFYPIVCKKQRKYDIMEMSSV